MPAVRKPLASMTGYGRGTAANRYAEAEAELRSVNGKGLSLKLRVPGDRLELEQRAEALLRKRLRRGSLQGSLRVQAQGRTAVLDPELLGRYLREWRRAARSLGLADGEPGLADLLALPGALQTPPESEAVRRGVLRAAEAALTEALERLIASRVEEGRRLARELQRLVRAMRGRLRQVEGRLPRAREAAAKRLRERIEEAWARAGVTEPLDLTREIAVLAERADVREEVARLGIHLDRLEELLAAGGPCGRELDFVLQECHREVNTLGSKSADPVLARRVVELKLLVQQAKEQAANVE